MDLNRLLKPKSIAVVGGVQAREVIRQCVKMGFSGDIWPVHPVKSEVEGFPVFASVEVLPGVPDAVFIGVNRNLTIEVVEALSAMGAGGAVCYASGFLEADETGQQLQQDLLAAAGDMPVLGPNCYGYINCAEGVPLWPDQHGCRVLKAQQKGVAIVTQSSNISINMTMQRRGLPLAYMLTAGNQAQIGLSDLALAALEDDRVTALGVHIEGFDCIQKFEALALRARELGKPIVVLKVGRSDQAKQAAMTHTASMAGSHRVAEAFLQRLGVGSVRSIPEFLETLKLLHVHGVSEAFTLGSMSCSGGEASIMADAVSDSPLYYPVLKEDKKKPMQVVLGDLVTLANPLDYHTYIWHDEEGMSRVFAAMLECDFEITSLVLDFPHQAVCDDEDWRRALRAYEKAVHARGKKAAVIASLTENLPERYVEQLMDNGIVAIGGIAEAVCAYEVAANMGAAWQRPLPDKLTVSLTQSDSAINAIALKQYKHHKGEKATLDEARSKAILSEYNLPILQHQIVENVEAAVNASRNIGYPVVLKRLGIAHKTEMHAVRLNLKTASMVSDAAQALLAIESDQGFLVESMVCDGIVELIVGLHKDDQFGWVLTIGSGGVLVELLQDTQTLLLPVSPDIIREKLGALRCAALLEGYRGQSAADVEAVVECVMSIQSLALGNSHAITELDINPLIVCKQGAFIADALIVTASN